MDLRSKRQPKSLSLTDPSASVQESALAISGGVEISDRRKSSESGTGRLVYWIQALSVEV